MDTEQKLDEQLLNAIHSFRKALRQKKSLKVLPMNEFIVLINVKRMKKDNVAEIYPSDLSDHIEISRPYITAALNSLENKGYITRSVSKKDRRMMCVELTGSGIEILNRQAEIDLAEAKYLSDNLKDNKTVLFIELLNEASKILKEQGDIQNG
ncbi:MAG: MarR family transcriptional regulator [Clostridia bacterium]|jgi:DNA-binding MarR family transcriptional regulator